MSLSLSLSYTVSLSTPKASSGILDAFVAAESLRRELVSMTALIYDLLTLLMIERHIYTLYMQISIYVEFLSMTQNVNHVCTCTLFMLMLYVHVKWCTCTLFIHVNIHIHVHTFQVEARQKLLEVKEKESNGDLDEDEPVTSCRNKALYLLKFAGLSRVMFGNDERPGSPVIRRPSWGQKSSWRWQRVSSVVSTVSKIKQQVSGVIN